MGFPTTLQEFQAAFPDEQACWEALRGTRWPEGFVCPRCAHAVSSWISTRGGSSSAAAAVTSAR